MKILVATGLFPPEIGGPATYSEILLKELPARGFDIKILPFRTVRKYPKILRHLAYFFKVLFQARGCDMIFALDPVSVGFPAVLAAKILRKKYYVKIVGDYAWEQGCQRAGVKDFLDEFSQKKSGYGFLVRLLKIVQTFVANQSDKIIVPSFYLKKIVSNWGVRTEKIKVVYNAFEDDAKLDRVDRSILKKDLKISGQFILSVGRLVPWKGFDTLISLMAELKEIFPELKLLIAGDGPDKDKLQKIIDDNFLTETVCLLGRVEHDHLLKYLRAADVFVLNTSYEGFSHQLLETMAVGTPIVTTNVGGNPELIKDGENGLLVPFNDGREILRAINRILRDGEEAGMMVGNGLKTIQNFNRENMIIGLIKELK